MGRVPVSKRYVVGFLLNQYRSTVVLIQKNRPAWQAGRLNGVGGKIELGEDPADAMAREFLEETGYRTEPGAWRELCTIAWPDDAIRVGDAEPTSVIFFTLTAPVVQLDRVIATQTDEYVNTFGIDWLLLTENRRSLIPNLTWLLPLAVYSADRYEPFTVYATVEEAVSEPPPSTRWDVV